MVWLCKNCKENGIPPIASGYRSLIDEYEKDVCPHCHNKLISVPLTNDEFDTIADISGDQPFIEAMIALKERDIIEFQLKMSQFKASLSHQTKTKEEKRTDQVICPYCRSDNTRRISGISKAASVAMMGVYAIVESSRQWHCNNCQSDF